jgi:hypothetical protein
MPEIKEELKNSPIQEAAVASQTTASHEAGALRLTNSMNPEYFNHSRLSMAYELQKQQKFGKDTVNQLFTCNKSLPHVVLPLYKTKFLVKKDLKCLWIVLPITQHLWQDWKQTKKIPFKCFQSLREPHPNWKNQEKIDDKRVDLRLALLLHYDCAT